QPARRRRPEARERVLPRLAASHQRRAPGSLPAQAHRDPGRRTPMTDKQVATRTQSAPAMIPNVDVVKDDAEVTISADLPGLAKGAESGTGYQQIGPGAASQIGAIRDNP